MQKHVFVSYKHEDSDFAQVLIYKIKEAGFETWVDNDQLHAGEDWRAEIDNAIKNAVALIVGICMGGRSQGNPYYVQGDNTSSPP